MEWSDEPEPPPPPPSRERRTRAPDPLAGLAEELSRAPAPPDAGSGDMREARPPRRETRLARQQPAPPPVPAPSAEQQFNSAADQNLAEMAQRLEAALRRPAAKSEEPRFAEPAPRSPDQVRGATAPEPAAAEEDYPPPPPARAPAEARPARGEPRPGRTDAKPAAGKSLYDSLEQEMASLLGRPDRKT